MNWDRGIPAARIWSIPNAISFLRTPTMNAMAQTAGSPSIPAITGESGSTIGSSRSYPTMISMTMDPMTRRGRAM